MLTEEPGPGCRRGGRSRREGRAEPQRLAMPCSWTTSLSLAAALAVPSGFNDESPSGDNPFPQGIADEPGRARQRAAERAEKKRGRADGWLGGGSGKLPLRSSRSEDPICAKRRVIAREATAIND